MRIAQLTSNPPPTASKDGVEGIIAGFVECAAQTPFVPTLLQIGRGIEDCGHRAEVRFKRDASGRIADGIELDVVLAPKPTTFEWITATTMLCCKYCEHDIDVDVLVRRDTITSAGPSTPVWRAAREVTCRHCPAVYPAGVLNQLTELAEAVRELDGESNEVPA
jgi:hypothetical protein